LVPALDLASNLLPFAPGNLRWRYGAVGLTTGFLLTPLLGVALASAVAVQLEHRRMRGVLRVLHALTVIAFLLAAGLFALDVLQLRPAVLPESRPEFDIGAMKAMLKLLGGIVAWSALFLGMGRAARRSKAH
jgi:hypothetical protein